MDHYRRQVPSRTLSSTQGAGTRAQVSGGTLTIIEPQHTFRRSEDTIQLCSNRRLIKKVYAYTRILT